VLVVEKDVVDVDESSSIGGCDERLQERSLEGGGTLIPLLIAGRLVILRRPHALNLIGAPALSLARPNQNVMSVSDGQ
jgi:hypothetical protein